MLTIVHLTRAVEEGLCMGYVVGQEPMPGLFWIMYDSGRKLFDLVFDYLLS